MPINKDFYMLAGSSGQSTGYEIDQSIRFARVSNTSGNYMQRDFGSAGDRTSWTWSCWFKLGSLNNFTPGSNLYYQFLACDNAKNDSNRGSFHIIADTSVASAIAFQFQGHSTSFIRTNRQFRDPSAWMHLVLVWDSDNAIPSERTRLYINGTRETDFAGSSNPTSGQEIGINLGEIHRLGISYNISGAAVNYPFDGYMADIHFLDGYSYGPEYFGEFDDYDNWIPKEYTGSYGSNGFKIDGRDSSDLGDDESGNGNDFSTSGFAADDQQPDSPTNNHAVFNPLDVASNGFTTFSEGNLAITYSGSSARELARSTITIPANTDGFFEVKMTATLGSGTDFALGIEDGSALQDASNTTYTNAYVIREDGSFSTTGSSSTTSYGVSFTNNDVIGVWRKANGDLVFYKNGTAMNSGTPAVTGVTGEMHFVAGGFNGGAGIARFSSDQWTNTPTGVSSSMALTTKNLFG